MRVKREWLEELIFGGELAPRWTQDSPVLPDVWIDYGLAYTGSPPHDGANSGPDATFDLLLTPHRDTKPSDLGRVLRERLRGERATAGWRRRHPDGLEPHDLAYNKASVAARISFDELVRVVLPLSNWWYEYVLQPQVGRVDPVRALADPGERGRAASALRAARKGQVDETSSDRTKVEWKQTPGLLWLMRIVGAIQVVRKIREPGKQAKRSARDLFRDAIKDDGRLIEAFTSLVEPPRNAELGAGIEQHHRLLWLVTLNRQAKPTVWRSRLSVKADAADRVFELSCATLAWGIMDSGIDARHPAFWKREKRDTARASPPEGTDWDWTTLTRVKATYDFTRIRQLLNADTESTSDAIKRLKAQLERRPGDADAERWRRDLEFWERFARREAEHSDLAAELRRTLEEGRSVDWDVLRPLIEIPRADYAPPLHDHGTHVAGILAADWRRMDWPATAPHSTGWGPEDNDLVGVCPDIQLYDFRVLNEEGRGDEFAVMAALQFVRHLNEHRDEPLIHGLNLSLAIPHDKANYACGRTPVCDECERVVNSGVVVVAAAGNEGYASYATPTGGTVESYRSISIADPGNAQSVITVGSTHRFAPHTYGVSYFSSRGPTGDGRQKPDLVAPGEKIKAPTPGTGAGDQLVFPATKKDGTSMAAPHVSGAAALLLARYRELLGEPRRVKQILCDTATDLGREKYFQGTGMVDVLRALQSV